MKCREENDILLSSCETTLGIGICSHEICQACFKNENITTSIIINTNQNFTCPLCHVLFYINMQSIDEAILIG